MGDREFCLDSVDEYRAYLKPLVKTPTIHLELIVIWAFITYLYKRKYFAENWGENIELPKIKKVVGFVPTQEQAIDAILLGTEPGDGDNKLSRKRKSVTRNALRFIVLTGIRQCELHKLRVKDIDLATTEFKIQSKGGDEDKLAFTRALTEILEEALQDKKPNNLVFKCTKKHLNSCLKDGKSW